MWRSYGKELSLHKISGLILLARFPEPWQADMVVSLLASEGIQAFLSDEHFVRNTRHSVAIGGVGIVVREADASAAWEILQRAERGELSLPSEMLEYPDERIFSGKSQDKRRQRADGYKGIRTRNRQLETQNHVDVRCPRCGSANSEKRKGLLAFFSPGNSCRVCHWEWKGSPK